MRRHKLGMHTYALNLWGFGMTWFGSEHKKDFGLIELMDKAVEWGLDGLHITGTDLETRDDKRLDEVAEAARNRGLFLEYNFSRADVCDKRINDTLENAAYVCHKLGAKLAKYSLDIDRKPPLHGSCMQAHVMKQLAAISEDIQAAMPAFEKYGVKLALENHTETYADEIIWLMNSISHPLVGICLDTVNSLCVLEGIDDAIRKLAPYAICCHLCDHKLSRDEYGARFHGVAVGDGDIDCKKVMDLIRKVSPMEVVNFEIEWDVEGDTLEVAKKKQMDACIQSIKYCREVLKIGREDELLG